MDLDLSIGIVVTLLCSGVIVGFINTLAGGATVISMTIFMVLGMPLTIANGTNRVAVVLQNLTSSLNFRRNNMLDLKMGVKLGIPTIFGCIVGSMVASFINEDIFKICLGVVLFLVLIFMVFSPTKMLKGEAKPIVEHPDWKIYFWFLIAGFYSGYIYVGLGYLILTVAILNLNYDIMRANALKCFIVLISTPFSLAIFMLNGQVDYAYGLIHAIGNIGGAFLASQYGTGIKISVLRLLLISVILITLSDIFGIIDLQHEVWKLFNLKPSL